MLFISFRKPKGEPSPAEKHLRAGRIMGFHVKRLSDEFYKRKGVPELLAKVAEHQRTVNRLLAEMPLRDVLKGAFEAEFASWFQKLKHARISYFESELDYMLRFQLFVAKEKAAGRPVYKRVFGDMSASITMAVNDLELARRATKVSDVFPRGHS